MKLDRPAIWVQPLHDVSSNQRNIGACIAKEICIVIARGRWITVGAPEVARYHLSGRIRINQDGTLVVVMTLLDTETGRTIWADRWSGMTAEVHGIPEYAAARIGIALEAAVLKAEIQRACRTPGDERGSWRLVMRAFPHALTIDARSQACALEFLECAMELAPNDPLPAALAAWCHAQRGTHHFTNNWSGEKRASRHLAQRVSKLNNASARAEALLGTAETLAHNLIAGKAHCDRAIALDSTCVWGWIRLGFVHAYMGQSADAIECFQVARSLNPDDPLIFSCSIGMGVAYFEIEDYAGAIKWWRRLLVEHPSSHWAHRFLAPAFLMAGQKEEAAWSFSELSRYYRSLTTSDVRSALPHTKQYMDRACDGLEHLGMRP